MDSVTQIVLGASVAEACLGRRVGGKAALAGAVLGTLPDLDSFIPYASDVATFTFHRSFSHSLLLLSALSPLFAWLTLKALRQPREAFGAWWLLTWLVLITHPLLDAFTVYGTQLLWPLTEHPFSGASIFIIDPAYTLPLAACLLSALRLRRDSRARAWINAAGLAAGSLYLAWSMAARVEIEAYARAELSRQDIAWERLLATPAPFNTLLWRVVVIGEEGYYESFHHVLRAGEPLRFAFQEDDRRSLLPALRGHWPVERLRMFTHGFFSLQEEGGTVHMTDLRMGLEPAYIFSFKVAEVAGGDLRPLPGEAVPGAWEPGQLRRVWDRLWH